MSSSIDVWLKCITARCIKCIKLSIHNFAKSHQVAALKRDHYSYRLDDIKLSSQKNADREQNHERTPSHNKVNEK